MLYQPSIQDMLSEYVKAFAGLARVCNFFISYEKSVNLISADLTLYTRYSCRAGRAWCCSGEDFIVSLVYICE